MYYVLPFPTSVKGGGQLLCTSWLFSEKTKAKGLDLILYVSLSFKFKNLMGN